MEHVRNLAAKKGQGQAQSGWKSTAKCKKTIKLNLNKCNEIKKLNKC